MEIRVLHCSDIHLDASYSHIWGMGNIKREEQRETFVKICQIAKQEKVDIVLIAGDLFELVHINTDTIRFIKENINLLSPIPVCITPGNEDPLTEDSPYSYPEWPSNTIIFNTNRFRAEEFPEKKMIIYGAANKAYDDTYKVMKSLHLKKKEGIHIAVFHGTDTKNKPALKVNCLPFTREEITASNVHYLALGHFHNKGGIPEEKPSAYYCGAPDYLNFEEEEEKGVTLVRIKPDGNEISFIPTWKRKFCTEIVPCEKLGESRQIIEYIKKISESKKYETSITKITLQGYVNNLAKIDTEKIVDEVKQYFFHVVIKDETLPHFDIDRLKEEKSTRGKFVSEIIDMISKHPEDEKTLNLALYRGLEAFISPKVDTK